MVNQSDIPSQLSAPVSRGGFIPAPSSNISDTLSISPYSVSVYDTLPQNALAYTYTPDFDGENFPLRDGFGNPIYAQLGFFDVPSGGVFAMRHIDFQTSIFYTPPFANHGFLYSASGLVGNANIFGLIYMSIYLGSQSAIGDPSPYMLIPFRLGELGENNFNCNLNIDQNTRVRIYLHRGINSSVPGAVNYNPDLYVPRMNIYGHILPSTGVAVSDQTLTQSAVPVRV